MYNMHILYQETKRCKDIRILSSVLTKQKQNQKRDFKSSGKRKLANIPSCVFWGLFQQDLMAEIIPLTLAGVWSSSEAGGPSELAGTWLCWYLCLCFVCKTEHKSNKRRPLVLEGLSQELHSPDNNHGTPPFPSMKHSTAKCIQKFYSRMDVWKKRGTTWAIAMAIPDRRIALEM